MYSYLESWFRSHRERGYHFFLFLYQHLMVVTQKNHCNATILLRTQMMYLKIIIRTRHSYTFLLNFDTEVSIYCQKTYIITWSCLLVLRSWQMLAGIGAALSIFLFCFLMKTRNMDNNIRNVCDGDNTKSLLGLHVIVDHETNPQNQFTATNLSPSSHKIKNVL